jgi:transketolase
MSFTAEQLTRAAVEARGLAIDAVHACNSGHLGLPLGCAEIGAVLWGKVLSYHPGKPDWLNRDRFVLSAGHGSMFIYSWLHLSGYDLSRDDLRAFRKLESKTPGHPENFMTPGVEATTGPLGQGTGNIVGMAVAQKMAASLFNTAEHTIFDHHVIGLAGDGCLQEGISYEAAAFAGRYGLDNLILIYDSNDVTLDAMAKKSQIDDAAGRYAACNWDITTLADGHDLAAIEKALTEAKTNNNGRPKLIIAKTEIGRGIPDVAGTAKAHGEGGAKFAEAARKGLGLPEETFFVSQETEAAFEQRAAALDKAYKQWLETFEAWKAANPDKAKLLQSGVELDWGCATDLLTKIPEFAADKALATRAAGGVALNHLAPHVPLLNSGAADLHGSTKNYIKDAGDFDVDTPTGRNFYYGIREHAMGAILNGFGYYGLFKASGATFLTFADYMRPSVRLAALSKLPVFYIWTHDSVGVGEDGPTHQPVELVASLRAIPNLTVLRPADPEETAAAFAFAVAQKDGPVALVLSRQSVPTLSDFTVAQRREGTLKGAYILKKETEALETILLASGSEVQHALAAAAELGGGCRVVSVPSFELFREQSPAYQSEVLPQGCRKRVAIEAGISQPWYQFVGLDGKVLGIDRFGLSAPGATVMQELGMTAQAVVLAARSL